jgi:hypothetical protein
MILLAVAVFSSHDALWSSSLQHLGINGFLNGIGFRGCIGNCGLGRLAPPLHRTASRLLSRQLSSLDFLQCLVTTVDLQEQCRTATTARHSLVDLLAVMRCVFNLDVLILIWHCLVSFFLRCSTCSPNHHTNHHTLTNSVLNNYCFYRFIALLFLLFMYRFSHCSYTVINPDQLVNTFIQLFFCVGD